MFSQHADRLFILLLAILPTVLARLEQNPLGASFLSQTTSNVTADLFNDLEELSRIVDIAYCVGTAGLGIQKPFLCASRCQDFKHFELVKTWNTGVLFSDSCGYIALSHPPATPRIIVAFRGTYSIANTIIDLSTIPQPYVPYPGGDEGNSKDSWRRVSANSLRPERSRCDNCMVHEGFMTSWQHTRPQMLDTLQDLIDEHPDYRLTLVGHSLGGAVAALASLEFHALGWKPQVTTFGEPKIGNHALMKYIDDAFDNQTSSNASHAYRRVTHVDDPVPLLPLSELGYTMHGGEIYISKPSLPPKKEDLHLCEGDHDPRCIAGADTSWDSSISRLEWWSDIESLRKWWLKSKGALEVPARFRAWQLFFAHRDYFWRLGLCVPGGDPAGW